MERKAATGGNEGLKERLLSSVQAECLSVTDGSTADESALSSPFG